MENKTQNTTELTGNVKDVFNFAAEEMKPTILTLDGPDGSKVPVVAVKSGMSLQDVKPLVDSYRKNPERKRGTLNIQTLTSFIEITNRFKDKNSALFLDKDRATLTAIFDYNEPTDGIARFGQHRARYSFPFSNEWARWVNSMPRQMSQIEFANFLKDNIVDIMSALSTDASKDSEAEKALRELLTTLGGRCGGPADIMKLATGVSFNAEQKVVQSFDTDTGESQINFEEKHTAGKSMGSNIKVPNMFLIGIPVFEDGAIYRLPVRLKYRLSGGSIVWSIEVYRAKDAIKNAFAGAAATAKEKTALPLFYGADEQTDQEDDD